MQEFEEINKFFCSRSSFLDAILSNKYIERNGMRKKVEKEVSDVIHSRYVYMQGAKKVCGLLCWTKKKSHQIMSAHSLHLPFLPSLSTYINEKLIQDERMYVKFFALPGNIDRSTDWCLRYGIQRKEKQKKNV